MYNKKKKSNRETPKHPKTVCRNWSAPKFSVPLNKLKPNS